MSLANSFLDDAFKAEVQEMLREDELRKAHLFRYFNPISGKGSTGERFLFKDSRLPGKEWMLPKEMLNHPLLRVIEEAGGIARYAERLFKECVTNGEFVSLESVEENVLESLIRLRCQHDFPFWAATFVTIKSKTEFTDLRFKLNSPQRKLVEALEKMRTAGLPIRLILVKARQWGGSTCIQMYMSWLQIVHKTNLNSLIVGNQKDASYEVRDMFDRMLRNYPARMLHDMGEAFSENETKIENVGASGNIRRLVARNCKIKIGTAEKPDSARGGDYSLVHCTEVGLWKETDGKKPEDIIRSACSGVLLRPYTLIVYESTANGIGNFFEREYRAAKNGVSQFTALFVAWFEIELYRLPLTKPDRRKLAIWLLKNKENTYAENNKEESGAYLYSLWEKGATLEGIAWYIQERRKYSDHNDMASEYPSDDDEAFAYSGQKVFGRPLVEQFRKGCKPARWVGEVVGDAEEGKQCLEGLSFVEDSIGRLKVWSKPERGWKYRYLVAVDVGGRSANADYSVIWVIDRLFMNDDGGKPETVAQWYGHIDMDQLAWKAAQIAKWYDDALLVIESNTLESRSATIGGDHSEFILYQIKSAYDNLYAREPSEQDIKEGNPLKYGFHTNASTKTKIIDNLVKVVRKHEYIERETLCLDEMLTYELKKNGAYGAIDGKHDDLLMTRAIGLYICFNFNVLPLPKERNVKRLQATSVKKPVSAAVF